MSTITRVTNMLADMMQVSGELDRFFGEMQEDMGYQIACSDDADEARHWQGQYEAVTRFGEVFMSLGQKDIDRLRLAASLVDEVSELQSGLLGYVDDELEALDAAERQAGCDATEEMESLDRFRDLLLQIGSDEE